MLNGFTAEHDDKRFSPVGIDIGNRMAESLDQLGFTFLYHGTPLCMIILN
ncbi:amino-acid acetyltransferase domain protein [Shigella flexneri CCH060]|uniref:Amino-acid acetyltransferase domain protein n=2 Tax=Shigella TaxID=620 RepID=A0A6N3R148_SHIFL|nr:amino-acid acetyltransferase domain protein [Shigella flexneri CCH060]EIQ35305.1 amino-acid acetyltransferase domain protein [Shigella boydii 4444-74]